MSRLTHRSAAGATLALGWLTSSWIVGSLLCASQLDRLRECRLDVDAADLDAVLFSSTRSVATQTWVLTDKTRIHLRSASVWTYTFFTTGFPRFLSICGARGLLALNQVLI
jgi:hypothetical protein